MQDNNTQSLKYCLYARKSTEQDERQAMSIDSQIKEMVTMAQRDGIQVLAVKQESHSAKLSTKRPVFNEMLEEIADDKFDAILTWAPDRLSRNAGDLGSLVDLMDAGQLQEIKTFGQNFRNNPNEKFLLMILCSQAKLENDNRAINVKWVGGHVCHHLGISLALAPARLGISYSMKNVHRIFARYSRCRQTAKAGGLLSSG